MRQHWKKFTWRRSGFRILQVTRVQISQCYHTKACLIFASSEDSLPITNKYRHVSYNCTVYSLNMSGLDSRILFGSMSIIRHVRHPSLFRFFLLQNDLFKLTKLDKNSVNLVLRVRFKTIEINTKSWKCVLKVLWKTLYWISVLSYTKTC